MRELTNKEKIALIIEICKKHDITAYEIGEKTSVSNVAAHNILTGATENPRGKTLNIILNYVEDKITGKNVPGHRNYKIEEKIHTLAEDPFNFGEDLGEIKKMLQNLQKTIRIDHDAIAEGVKKVYLNTEDLIDGSEGISNSITSLITAINDKT